MDYNFITNSSLVVVLIIFLFIIIPLVALPLFCSLKNCLASKQNAQSIPENLDIGDAINQKVDEDAISSNSPMNRFLLQFCGSIRRFKYSFVIFAFAVCALVVLLLLLKTEPQEPPETLQSLVLSLNELLGNLRSTDLTIDNWATSFTAFHRIMLKIGNKFSVGFEEATQIRDHCLGILQILLNKPAIWNYFPITERVQILTHVEEVITEMVVLLHANNITTEASPFASNQIIELQTKSAILSHTKVLQFDFESAFFLSIPLHGLNLNSSLHPSGSTVFISAFLIRNLSAYLSFDYPINSHILRVIIGKEKNSSITLKNDQKVMFTSKNLAILSSENVPECTTWNVLRRKWSSDDCQLVSGSNNQWVTICECGRIATYATITKGKIDDIIENIEGILQSITFQEDISKGDWTEYMKNLTNWISQTVELDLTDVTPETAINLAKPSIEILNILIDQKDIWEKGLNRFERTRSASAIFTSIEDLSVLLDTTQLNSSESSFEISLSSIQLETRRFNITREDSMGFHFTDYKVTVPFAAFPIGSLNQVVVATCTVVRNLSPFLSADLKATSGIELKTNILSLVVNQNKTGSTSLNGSVRFETKFNQNSHLRFGHRPSCEWWNFSSLSWSKSNCSYLEKSSNRSFSVCECSHLTNFAVLIDVNNEEIKEDHKTILSCIFSSLTVVLSTLAIRILLKQFFRSSFDFQKNCLKLRATRPKINFHIAIWLLVTHLMVLLLLDQDGLLKNILSAWPFACSLSSLFLLYSLLTLFTLLLLINYHLYCSIAKLRLHEVFPLKKYLVMAYLSPLALILCFLLSVYFFELNQTQWNIGGNGTIGALWSFIKAFLNVTDRERWSKTVQSMSGEYFCWISSKSSPHHIYIFLVPMTVIITLNFLFLIQSLLSYLRNARFQSTSLVTFRPVNRNRQRVKLSIECLFFANSCLPWALYLLYINNWLFGSAGAKIFSVVFIVLTGTQGLTLFSEQYLLFVATKHRRKEQRQSHSISTSAPQSTLTLQTSTATTETTLG